jgi:hypothetical protein
VTPWCSCDLALVSGQLPVLQTVRPHVGVLIGIADIVDPGSGHDAATTGMGAADSAARARRTACDSTVSRIVMGRTRFPWTWAATDAWHPLPCVGAVELREQCWVFAGCEAPAWRCEVHLVLHRGDGGERSLENSALLCGRHHGQVRHGFSIVRDPAGRWLTYRPDGTEILPCTPRCSSGSGATGVRSHR